MIVVVGIVAARIVDGGSCGRRFSYFEAYETMSLRIILTILLLASTAGAQTPIGMQKWQIDDTTFTMRFGGAPQNYPNSEGWQAIENDFHVNGSGIFESSNRLLKTFVDSLGDVIVTYTYNEIDYTVIQQPHSLKFFRKTDSAWINIDNYPNFNNISLDGNTIRWGNMYPGVNYKVILSNGRVENRYEFKPVFLDSAVVLYNQRSDSANIYLANVMKFTLSASIDEHDVPLGNIRKRVLKRFGGMVFQIGKTYLRGFPGADTLNIPVWQRHIFVGNQLYVLEFVKMSDVKRIHELYPTATLWHTADFTLDNDTDIHDATIYEGSPDNNYGGRVYFRTATVGANDLHSVIKADNVHDSIGAGATFSFAAGSLYCYQYDAVDDPDIEVYPLWKTTWIQGDEDSENNDDGDVTWNDWESDANEWGTEGVLCADDNGSFNTEDDGTCVSSRADRKATYVDTMNPTTDGEWLGFEFTAWAQTCYDNSKSMGFKLEPDGENDFAHWFRSREYGSNGLFWTFVYTTDGAPAAYGGQVIMIGGQ